MKILTSTVQKSLKFISKQYNDIAKYGKNNVKRVNVTDEMLDTFVPFRRLSKKPCTLSEPNFFIKKFEEEVGKDYLPLGYEKLSSGEKIDYIVRDRYSRIVSHKIMNNIKDESIEHGFALNPKGEIVYYNKGDTMSCNIDSMVDGISIHNHPGCLGVSLNSEEITLLKKHYPGMFKSIAHSGEDLKSTLTSGERVSYVVDRFGNKFSLEQPIELRSLDFDLEKFAMGSTFSRALTIADNVLSLNAHMQKAPAVIEELKQSNKDLTTLFNLKGTSAYNETEFERKKLENLYLYAKSYYPDLSHRENRTLPALDSFGFRFTRV